MLLQDKLKNRRLILASHSPRRRELLRAAGIDYVLADKYECEEIYPPELLPTRVPLYLAELKSRNYPEELAEGDILVTADTAVVVAGQILGKPADRAEAVAMLERLSGHAHTVVTGVTIRSVERTTSFAVESSVSFRRLTREEIEYYVDECRPFDKAGGYGIQEWIGYVGIESIRGSFFNVMGLPTQRLYTELDKFIG